MKKLLYLIPLTLLLIITGCAANGPKYVSENNISTDKDNLYIYRPYNFLSGGLSADVYIDGAYKGTLKNDGYLKINIKTGNHTIRVGKQQKSFVSHDNKKLFFKFNYGWALFFVIPISPQSLDIVNENIAVNELNETKATI